jgi:tRNA C32,U32 (ribose-2'-O)-methylase TrmJ
MKVLMISLLTISGFMAEVMHEGSYPSFFAFATAVESSKQSEYTKQKQLEVIDNEIESLMNLRDYYTSRMSRYRNRASRYEFQGDNLEESKHLLSEADKMEGVIKQIDEEINRLEKERNALLKK